MVARTAPRMERLRVEQGANLEQRALVFGEWSPIDQSFTCGGPVQAEDHPQSCRLAGPVGAEESGDLAWRGITCPATIVRRPPRPVVGREARSRIQRLAYKGKARYA